MSVQDDKGIDAGRSSEAAPFHVEDLLGYMRGGWLFERKVFDSLRKDEATCTGRSAFTPHRHNGVEALNYSEQGELNLGDLTITTEREYIYTFPAPSLRRKCPGLHGFAPSLRFPGGTGSFSEAQLSRLRN